MAHHDAGTIDNAGIGKVLLHRTQRNILECMVHMDEPMSPNMLSQELREPLGNVSYHVGVLAGKPTRNRDGTRPGKFADNPLIELYDTRQRRGALEHLYVVTKGTKLEACRHSKTLDDIAAAIESNAGDDAEALAAVSNILHEAGRPVPVPA